jgi:cold-inducible RNA-binding protein
MKNIFVGNLDFGATEDQLRSMFENYGAVDRVIIITDRDTGRSRGFAFVEMPGDEEAGRAIEALNGQDLNGRTINVNEARPKSDRGGFGGGGGGRPGGGGGRPGGGHKGPRREPRW